MAWQSPPEGDSFWEDHKEPEPKTLAETITGTKEFSELLSVERFFISEKIGIAKNSQEKLTRGNGFCGIYAILSTLMISDPSISEMKYKDFIEMIKPFLEEHGFRDCDPLIIDADVICRAMRDFLKIVGVDNASFAFFSFSDQTVKFDRTSSNFHPENLFCILCREDHFTGLYLEESYRKIAFRKLSTEFGYM